MSMDPNERLTDDQRRAREALRSLRLPAADPAFRARLRTDFIAGRIAAAPARVVRPAWQLRPMVRFGLAPLAAAAALVVLAGLNRGPAWRVSSSGGEGIAIVDGRPVPIGHASDLAALVRPGARVSVPAGSDLEIVSGHEIAIQILAGSDFTVPRAPARWLGRLVSAQLRSGEMRITTGAGFQGARLAVVTPETRVEVTGTTLAVIREPAGTCVCVLEGRVRIEMASSKMVEVEQGRRRFVFADGRPSEEAEMRHAEHQALPVFRDSRRPGLGESPGR